MAELQQLALVRIYSGGTTYARWQSAYLDKVISYEGSSWTYQQFSWEGVASGAGATGQGSLSLPATPSIRALLERALAGIWLVQLRVFQAPDDAAGTPPTGMVQVGSLIAEVIGGNCSLTTATLQLGSALAPLGAQFPPRTANTRLIGVPCRL